MLKVSVNRWRYTDTFLYVGHGIKLTGCKFLYVPS